MKELVRFEKEAKRKCCTVQCCPMTMGYYIGGGQYICWLHAMITPGIMSVICKWKRLLVALQPEVRP